MIGIIGAMDEEIEVFLPHIENLKSTKWMEIDLHTGKLGGKNVVVAKSGVGKVFAAMITQYLLDNFPIEFIIVTGVGGALDPNLDVGDVVVSKDSAYHDFDATKLGFKLGQISYTDYRFFKSDTRLVDLALKVDLKNHKVVAGRVLTGDQFFTDKEKREKKYLVKEFQGDCIEMEGAAIAHVCTINKIPHVIIRTISDKADEKAVIDYNKFKGTVAENSFNIVNEMLRKL